MAFNIRYAAELEGWVGWGERVSGCLLGGSGDKHRESSKDIHRLSYLNHASHEA